MDMMQMMQMMMAMKGGGGGKGFGGAANGGGKGGGGGGMKKWGNENKSATAWIGNLPEGITEAEIKENFGTAGTVRKVNITPKKRIGVIESSSAAEVQTAITMFNGADVSGSIIQVDVWSK